MFVRIPAPVSGGLILSYKCNASCRHCMYACSPKWRNEWIDRDTLNEMLRLLSGYIRPAYTGSNSIGVNEGLHFTGGEPFLNYELLLYATEKASAYGIPSLFVETNCFWAKDDETAFQMLSELKMAGMKGILISVNPFFLEYVPFERTEMAIEAALRVFGRNVVVYQFEYYRLFKALGIKGKMSFEDFLRIRGARDFMDRTEFFIMGRAAVKMEELGLFIKYRPESLYSTPCIPSFLRSWHNHYDLYSNIVPGFCGGLSLGNVFELPLLIERGIDIERYKILGFLVNENIEGLLKFAKEYGYTEKEGGYLSRCHLCLDIRMYLYNIDEKHDLFPELTPDGFYKNLL